MHVSPTLVCPGWLFQGHFNETEELFMPILPRTHAYRNLGLWNGPVLN